MTVLHLYVRPKSRVQHASLNISFAGFSVRCLINLKTILKGVKVTDMSIHLLLTYEKFNVCNEP